MALRNTLTFYNESHVSLCVKGVLGGNFQGLSSASQPTAFGLFQLEDIEKKGSFDIQSSFPTAQNLSNDVFFPSFFYEYG